MGNGTSIGRVRGLGPAHEGAHHWLVQRLTAIGNLVTVLFLIVSLLMLPNLSYEAVTGWMAQPLPAFMMALLVVSTFWHASLGLQVLVEDYVHAPGNRFIVLALIKIALFSGAAFGLFSIARLAFSAGAA